MEYEWDETKQAANQSRHRIGFEAANLIDWSEAVVVDRSRHKDGEPRYAGIGFIEDKLHMVIYMERGRMRIISLRRSNRNEEKIYAQTP